MFSYYRSTLVIYYWLLRHIDAVFSNLELFRFAGFLEFDLQWTSIESYTNGLTKDPFVS